MEDVIPKADNNKGYEEEDDVSSSWTREKPRLRCVVPGEDEEEPDAYSRASTLATPNQRKHNHLGDSWMIFQSPTEEVIFQTDSELSSQTDESSSSREVSTICGGSIISGPSEEYESEQQGHNGRGSPAAMLWHSVEEKGVRKNSIYTIQRPDEEVVFASDTDETCSNSAENRSQNEEELNHDDCSGMVSCDDTETSEFVEIREEDLVVEDTEQSSCELEGRKRKLRLPQEAAAPWTESPGKRMPDQEAKKRITHESLLVAGKLEIEMTVLQVETAETYDSSIPSPVETRRAWQKTASEPRGVRELAKPKPNGTPEDLSKLKDTETVQDDINRIPGMKTTTPELLDQQKFEVERISRKATEKKKEEESSNVKEAKSLLKDRNTVKETTKAVQESIGSTKLDINQIHGKPDEHKIEAKYQTNAGADALQSQKINEVTKRDKVSIAVEEDTKAMENNESSGVEKTKSASVERTSDTRIPEQRRIPKEERIQLTAQQIEQRLQELRKLLKSTSRTAIPRSLPTALASTIGTLKTGVTMVVTLTISMVGTLAITAVAFRATAIGSRIVVNKMKFFRTTPGWFLNLAIVID